MNILLLGEFSGFHKNLKEGLIKSGHTVCLISSGDGWKKISGADYNLNKYTVADSLYKKAINLIYPFLMLSKYRNYDVVHVINPFLFSNHRFSEFLIKYIKNNNRSFTMSACGSDPIYVKKMSLFNYAPLTKSQQINYYNKKELVRFNFIHNLVDQVIPVMYDYLKGYDNDSKCGELIPLPINLDNYQYKDNIINEKFVIYHGITRANFKGSDYIIKALERLKKTHGDLVEIIVTEKLTFSEYQNVLNRCNILIDQCKSQAYGMNAIIGMSMGKVVLSGGEEKAIDCFKYNKSHPVINIVPNTDQIYKVLKSLLKSPAQIEEIGRQGNLMVKNIHSHLIIAEKYSVCWKNILKNK